MSVTGEPAGAVLGAAGFTWTASLETQPSNDNFLNATMLGDTERSVEGSTRGATTETGEPAHHGTASAAASVWWNWVAPTLGQVTFDTGGSDFDTVLAVYEGATLTTLEPVASNDDDFGAETSRVSFMTITGRTYHLVVAGFLGQTGDVRLNWTAIRSIGLEFDLPDRGVSESTSSNGPLLLTGSVMVEPASGNVAPAGIAILGLRQDGILVSEVAIPAVRPLTRARLYAAVAGRVYAGVAIANPNSTPADVSFVVTDSDGSTVKEGLTTLSPGEQLARFLNQPLFSVAALDGGTLTLSASAPVVVTAGTILFTEPGTLESPPGSALVELVGNDIYEFSLPPRSGQRIEARGARKRGAVRVSDTRVPERGNHRVGNRRNWGDGRSLPTPMSSRRDCRERRARSGAGSPSPTPRPRR